MPVITKRISGKILSRVLTLPAEMKEEELEITIVPVKKKKSPFSRLYSSPIKVNTISIPSRESLNER